MLNEKLSLKECLNILNEMIEELDECDNDSDGMYYIIVKGSKRNKTLLNKLIPDESNLTRYLYEYGEGNWRECGIDLMDIWQTIDCRFNTSIWFDMGKKEFYINESGKHDMDEEITRAECISYLKSWIENLEDLIEQGDPRKQLFEEQIVFLNKTIDEMEK